MVLGRLWAMGGTFDEATFSAFVEDVVIPDLLVGLAEGPLAELPLPTMQPAQIADQRIPGRDIRRAASVYLIARFGIRRPRRGHDSANHQRRCQHVYRPLCSGPRGMGRRLHVVGCRSSRHRRVCGFHIDRQADG